MAVPTPGMYSLAGARFFLAGGGDPPPSPGSSKASSSAWTWACCLEPGLFLVLLAPGCEACDATVTQLLLLHVLRQRERCMQRVLDRLPHPTCIISSATQKPLRSPQTSGSEPACGPAPEACRASEADHGSGGYAANRFCVTICTGKGPALERRSSAAAGTGAAPRLASPESSLVRCVSCSQPPAPRPDPHTRRPLPPHPPNPPAHHPHLGNDGPDALDFERGSEVHDSVGVGF